MGRSLLPPPAAFRTCTRRAQRRVASRQPRDRETHQHGLKLVVRRLVHKAHLQSVGSQSAVSQQAGSRLPGGHPHLLLGLLHHLAPQVPELVHGVATGVSKQQRSVRRTSGAVPRGGKNAPCATLCRPSRSASDTNTHCCQQPAGVEPRVECTRRIRQATAAQWRREAGPGAPVRHRPHAKHDGVAGVRECCLAEHPAPRRAPLCVTANVALSCAGVVRPDARPGGRPHGTQWPQSRKELRKPCASLPGWPHLCASSSGGVPLHRSSQPAPCASVTLLVLAASAGGAAGTRHEAVPGGARVESTCVFAPVSRGHCLLLSHAPRRPCVR